MKSNDQKVNKNFPEKKDFIYWLVIMVLLMIFLVVLLIDSPQKFSEQIALGAAIFSILLAIVGIIIPYIQGNESNRQNFQMLGEINRLSESVTSLSILRNDLSEKVYEQVNASSKLSDIVDKLGENEAEGEQADKIRELVQLNDNLKKQINEIKNRPTLKNINNEIKRALWNTEMTFDDLFLFLTEIKGLSIEVNLVKVQLSNLCHSGSVHRFIRDGEEYFIVNRYVD